MNGLDYAALAILGAGLALGYARGLVNQLVSIVGLIAAYAAAFYYYDDVAPLLRQLVQTETPDSYRKYAFLAEELHVDVYIYNAMAFALILFGLKLVFGIVGRMFNWLAAVPGLKSVNKWTGAALGALEAAVLVWIAIHVMTVVPSDTAQRWLSTSTAAPYVLEHTPVWTEKLQQLWLNQTERTKA
ncbi:CvpA family protein [Paenibacillus sp. YYML68]|uniref:CvpA family protein n=1 Tax=Paenibacillus sp. YYML68 TaxID=2909250 RepID=UPI002492BE29|nr:CvpA family protein [Paenibacillus sp. YYML68]